MRMPPPVMYPLLAATYPVLALAASNPHEIPGLWVLKWPLVISLLIALGGWFLSRVFVRDADRRAFLAFIVVVLFASYGYFSISLQEVAWAQPYADTVLPFLLLAGYLAATTYLVLRILPNPARLTRFLTVFLAVLVIWNAVKLLRYTTARDAFPAESSQPVRATTPPAASPSSNPDVYLIVLDKYTGSRSLRANFGFDNSEFESFLRKRGFVVPRDARANYIYTSLSLASLLNYRYLDDLLPGSKAQTRNKAYVNHLVEDNAVGRFLRSRDYRFIFFPTAFPVTGRNRFADLQVPDPRQILTEFEIVWRRTTLVQPVLSSVCQVIRCAHGATPFTAEIPQLLEWKFEQLSEVPKWPRQGRPLFVFAHITLPHEPYVFNANCSTRRPLWPSYSPVQDQTPEKQAYTSQISCLNRKLKDVVERLLRDSPTPPIILLQSDHGHGRMSLHIPDVDELRPDQLEERAHIFAAYHLPGAGRDVVYDSITPVNVFRTVFRYYFGADLPSLPDKTYWSPLEHPFKFTRIERGQRWSD